MTNFAHVIDAIGFCFDSVEDAQQTSMVAPNELQKLGLCILGVWLPNAIKQNIPI